MIEVHGERFGVEPICRVLEASPSTHYERRNRPPSARAVRDRQLLAEIRRAHQANYGVYGVRKVWTQLNREGVTVARCTVKRLMRTHGITGLIRGAKRRTTIPDPAAPRPPERVAYVDLDATTATQSRQRSTTIPGRGPHVRRDRPPHPGRA